ncbi:MAG: LysM peptidoglycan-binding domain-containing protein [Lachnospiraceae bacterium]|nr:LysM peptidoglycan-binding domain-containing protein [Lachnospiraceae bacterium]
MRHYRVDDTRSERRIRNNRIRRQREMRKNFLMFVMTVCLVITFSISLNGFRSDAKDDSVKTSYKYYKSITIDNNDTLWSIAAQYMDEEHYDSMNDYINEVKNMNSLTDDEIQYGEHLIIPYYDDTFVG